MADDALECDLESRSQTVDDDQALVSAAQRDTEAAGRLYDRYYREVLGYVYHCTLDYAATEDLTSNIFLAAFRHLGRFRWQQVPLRAWLYRSATNEVRMYYRRHKHARNADLRVLHKSSAPAGKKWITTKVVMINRRPCCWCPPVQTKGGKEIPVVLNGENILDLTGIYGEIVNRPPDQQ
jgi:RNA polymerase sigma factor (sigma-70 family)